MTHSHMQLQNSWLQKIIFFYQWLNLFFYHLFPRYDVYRILFVVFIFQIDTCQIKIQFHVAFYQVKIHFTKSTSKFYRKWVKVQTLPNLHLCKRTPYSFYFTFWCIFFLYIYALSIIMLSSFVLFVFAHLYAHCVNSCRASQKFVVKSL